jgi:predicted enzyme related to lactoylglutathione lyase
MIRFDSAVLMTENIDKMKEFYSKVMGQSVKHDFGGCVIFDCGLAVWKLGDGCPLAQALGGRASGNGSLEVCFDTEDFENDAANVKKSGVKLVHDIAEEQWGQLTIRFFDPDGNVVELGESIPAFCRRLYASGQSTKQVSEKTGVLEGLVREYVK